ncbi:MAG: hypothetical protein ACUVTX_09000, partial [Bacteroidales bacterium]
QEYCFKNMNNVKGRILVIVCLIFASCGGGDIFQKNDSRIRTEAMEIAGEYVSKQLKDPVMMKKKDGTVIFSDSLKIYIINPLKVYTGLIDDDRRKDVILTVDILYKNNPVDPEHFILLNVGNKLMLIKAIESDMIILQVSDRIITARIHTRPRTSPLYNCESCMEIVNYKYSDGALIKIEK